MSSDSYIMPFGKHKGQKLGDVPAGYLVWLSEQEDDGRYPKVREYIKKNLQHLVKESEEDKRRQWSGKS